MSQKRPLPWLGEISFSAGVCFFLFVFLGLFLFFWVGGQIPLCPDSASHAQSLLLVRTGPAPALGFSEGKLGSASRTMARAGLLKEKRQTDRQTEVEQ